MEHVLLQARGLNGTLELLPDRIRIRREGWTASFYDRQARTELLLQEIHEAELKHTIGGLAGYLAFHDAEGNEYFKDLCVSFLKHQEEQFVAIHRQIEQLRTAINDSHPTAHMQLRHDDAAL